MRSVTLLLITLSTVLFSTTILIYNGNVIVVDRYEVEGTKEITCSEGLQVMDVLHADEWYAIPGKKESWYDVMKNKKVKIVEELDGLEGEVVSLNPLVLKKENEAYLWDEKDKRWYIFEYETPGSTPDTLVVKSKKPVEVLYTTKGSWSVVYDIWEDGSFTAKALLPVIPVDEGNVFLISGFFERKKVEEVLMMKSAAPMREKGIEEPVEVEETKVYPLGHLKGLSKGLRVSFGSGKIKKMESIYSFSFPVNSGSFDYEKMNFSKVAENTEENGLGFPIPAGTVRFHKKIDDSDAIVNLGYVKDVPVRGEMILSLGSSWDVRVKGELLKSERYRTYTERTWKVTIMNAKKEPVKVRVVVRGESLKLLSSTMKCEERADRLVFEFIVQPGEFSFDFEARNRW
ncbi:MAG: hypothetical protein DRP24_05790 [Thermotoga sp.]|nr:MAG: hypothetical protein DRP23_01130 [Thermotogota bacterium]RKX54805.1 MAG: hypothetical protein DRP24_05790 [Thermotoga sp.]